MNKPGYNTANPLSYKIIKEIRDSLKNNPTKAELIMWEYLRNKKTGHKIRRQHVIDSFIADSVCLNKKVVIEIDGKVHLYKEEYDKFRTEKFNQLNYKVIRFTNKEVFSDPEIVTSKIKKYLDQCLELISPPLEGPGEVI
jgi:very-short-patch-repair endonuclease